MARSFVAACNEFFGRQPNQTLQQFGDELKQLTHEDKVEIAQGLREIGRDCDDPMPQK